VEQKGQKDRSGEGRLLEKEIEIRKQGEVTAHPVRSSKAPN